MACPWYAKLHGAWLLPVATSFVTQQRLCATYLIPAWEDFRGSSPAPITTMSMQAYPTTKVWESPLAIT